MLNSWKAVEMLYSNGSAFTKTYIMFLMYIIPPQHCVFLKTNIQFLFFCHTLLCDSCIMEIICGPSSESASSSIPSWQILTAHAQPFRGARDLVFCLKVPLDSLLARASSGGSGETAQMCRLAWTFAARICDKYQIRLTQPIWWL